MEAITTFIEHIKNYVLGLDWPYMITFIIISYGVNHYKVAEGVHSKTGIKMRTRYRVALVGLAYGIVIYFLRSYSRTNIENLFQSFVFALVFHKLVLEALFYWLAKHGLPEAIAKHILTQEQLQDLNQ